MTHSQQEIENKNTNTSSEPKVAFNFQRMCGVDQAILKTDEEWRNLPKLDQKLWMALSCPIAGLEFSPQTLALLDTDNDGRVRANEVLDAVDWICQRIVHPSSLCERSDSLAMENIREDTDEGRSMAQACLLALEKNGRKDSESMDLAAVEAVLAEASGYAFNGDGIVPPESAMPDNPEVEKFILLGLSIVGGKKDASGKPGLDSALADELRQRLLAVKNWRAAIGHTHLPLGEKTGEAWTLLTRLGPKIDDYFYRCRLAEFAPDALEKLNEIIMPESADSVANNPPLPAGFNRKILEAMPLARVTGGKSLVFGEAINPAWAGDLASFQSMLLPLLTKIGGSANSLEESAWKKVKESFAPYASTLENKPSYPLPAPDATRVDIEGYPAMAIASANDPLERNFLPLDADSALAALDDAEIEKFLAPEIEQAFSGLCDRDLAAPALTAIQDLRKALLFKANLYTFLMNFLSFLDFYNPEKKAIFQTGTLYLDSRACMLCVPVADSESHALLAAPSHLCLIYCDCSRRDADGAERTAKIAAALTAGSEGALIDGRHGVFVDNAGLEWDTRITKVIHNPVSLEEAVWAPYIRIAGMASAQIQKFVAAKDTAAASAAGKAATAIMPGGAPEQPKGGFDFAKGAGIFAALGVALSALSAAFAYVGHSLVSLGWWWPLALAAIFLCISGPSVIMAWFKLRRRNLGPLLDASGWAVNVGAPINIVMGNTLTTLGKLPPNARRNYDDPYSLPAKLRAQKRRRHFIWWCVFLLAIVAAGAAAWVHFFDLPAWFLKLRLFTGI